jgi:hypothetical protein
MLKNTTEHFSFTKETSTYYLFFEWSKHRSLFE